MPDKMLKYLHSLDNPENAIFQITDTKLNVPVVSWSKENDITLLEQLKSGFKGTIKWNKYRSQMTIQPQNNTDSRYSYSNYYVPKVKISDFNVLIDGKSLFDLPVKIKKKLMKKILKWVIIMTLQLIIY